MARKTRLKFGGDKFNRAIEDVQSGSVAISTASAEAIDAINDLNELIKNNMANSPYKNALRMSLMVLSLKMNSVLSNNGSIKDAIFLIETVTRETVDDE